MKIAVIGANGLIGKEICSYLDAVGITRENYPEYVGKKFDILINANGNSSKWQANDLPVYDFSANVESVYNSMFDFKFKKYVYISSYDAHNDSSYGLHKRIGEMIVKYYSDYVILRCSIVLGKQAVKGFLYDALNNIPLFVNSESEYQVVSNIELARIIKTIIDKGISNKEYYIGSRDTVKIGDLARILGRKINYRNDARYENYEWDVSGICKIYPMKTAEEYIREVL